MASRILLSFCSFFVFLFWAGATTDEDGPACDTNSYKCGEPPGDHCLDLSCYSFNTVQKTWNDSRNACREIPHSDLVSIETKDELVFLQQRIWMLRLERYRGWYVGLTVEEPIWEWLTGKPLTIEHWQKTYYEKQPIGTGNVVVMAKEFPTGQQGSFKDERDVSSYLSICEGPKASNEKYCRNNSCYTFNTKKLNWHQGRALCKKDGKDLVSIETESEWKYINDLIQNKIKSPPGILNEYFIGLRKTKFWNSWKWVNNEKYSLGRNMWGKKRPRGSTPFGAMGIAGNSNYPAKILSDASSKGELKPYICERKLVYTPPTK